VKKIFTLAATCLRWTWKFLTTGLTILSGLMVLTSIALVMVLIFYRPNTEIPSGAALVLAPQGDIVEKKSPLDPVSRMISSLSGAAMQQELLLQDVIDGIRAAADDTRIRLLVIAPDRMEKASLNQLRDIGRAINEFKKSGKVVIAVADNFNQGQYYLASWSDEIYLNPMGAVNLQGFGLFRLYMANLLEKLSINFHVFKVGTFKSALEPFIRNDMSPEARKANSIWLTNMWDRYCDDIAQHRGIPPRAINNAVNKLADNMKLAGGDSGRMALNNGLVDGLKTRYELRKYLKTLVGSNQNGTSFKQVSFNDYLTTIPKSYSRPVEHRDRVGILVARGNIVYGEAKVGQIGSDPLSRRIRKARKDKHIKALVLRVDSGGGSAFASELIRQELLRTRKAGKPVIISMGSMAASGAYWLAADADMIFAAPTTLTGSIGIFGALPTFENTLAKIGVHSDGTGTTTLAGAGDPTRSLPEEFSRALQIGVDRGYRRFINIVAQGRNMKPDQVEELAEGRVWDGATAVQLGLVDKLGSLEDAVTAAADMVGLPEKQAAYIEGGESPAELLLKSLGMAESLLQTHRSPVQVLAESLLQRHAPAFNFLADGDPQNIYSHCLLPGSAFTF
jgi:protease-4